MSAPGRMVPLLALLALVACGGSPARPTPTPSPAVVTAAVLDGITGASLDTRTGPVGAAVTIDRAGYLRRDTLLPSSGPVFLWPNTVSEEYVRAVVYAEIGRLMRWGTTTASIAPDYPARGLDELNALGIVTLVPTPTAPAITWTIDPADPYFAANPESRAVCFRNVTGATLATARIVFRTQADADSRRATHELGHAIGLGHSPRREDLMAAFFDPGQPPFSGDERVLLAMMYAHRRAGQVAPDNDQALGAATSIRRLVVVD